jgi:hypothetical protein
MEITTQRIVAMTVTVWPASENLQPYLDLWNFEQGQGLPDRWRREHKPSGLGTSQGSRPERLIGSVRRECLDLVLVFGVAPAAAKFWETRKCASSRSIRDYSRAIFLATAPTPGALMRAECPLCTPSFVY